MTVSVKCSMDLEQTCLLFIFTQWLSQLRHCSETQGQLAYLAELHFCQKFSTLAQDPSSGKKQILCPARLGGIPWVWELVGHLGGWHDCWPPIVRPLMEAVLPNCLPPLWFPLPTWHSCLTQSVNPGGSWEDIPHLPFHSPSCKAGSTNECGLEFINPGVISWGDSSTFQ